MIEFKLVKIENLKREKSVEFTDKQLDIIYESLDYFHSAVEDENILDEILDITRKIHNLTVKKSEII
jgi:hypothetical protein